MDRPKCFNAPAPRPSPPKPQKPKKIRTEIVAWKPPDMPSKRARRALQTRRRHDEEASILKNVIERLAKTGNEKQHLESSDQNGYAPLAGVSSSVEKHKKEPKGNAAERILKRIRGSAPQTKQGCVVADAKRIIKRARVSMGLECAGAKLATNEMSNAEISKTLSDDIPESGT